MSSSHYDEVLEELRNKKEILASKYITKLYFILRDEEHRTPEECRAKIESDCSDIWTEDTIRKYLPQETKNKTKRKAGKISAEVKRQRKANEANVKKREKAKPLVINSGINGNGSSSQTSVLIGGRGVSDGDGSDNSVGMNPTENSSVGQKEQELSTFQKMKNNQNSGNFRDEDPFLLLVAERLKHEALEEFEDSIPIEGLKTDLELSTEVRTRETIRALEKQVNDLQTDLGTKFSQLDRLAIECAMWKERYTQLTRALDPNNDKIIKGTTQIEFSSELLPVNIEYNFNTGQFSARIPKDVIEQVLDAIGHHG